MRTRILTAIACLAIPAGAWAQCQESAKATASKSCSGAKATAMCCGSKSNGCCGTTLARKLIPSMQYAVGDKTTMCPDEAKKLAGENGKVVFVVGEDRFEDQGTAAHAYAKLLNQTLTDITTVKYAVGDSAVTCPMTAKALAAKEHKDVVYRVAAFDFKSQDEADKAVGQARTAAKQVAMKMRVGDKEFCCATEAGKVAEADKKSIEYVVGDKSSACDVQASVLLATAKLEAAIAALDSAARQEGTVASAG